MENVMKYYKDIKDNIYAYEEDGSQDHLIGDKVAMTAEEVEAHINPPKTAEQLQVELNAEARAYLVSTDWYVIRLQENGIAVPQDVLDARAKARGDIQYA